jgi:hypothetical protein
MLEGKTMNDIRELDRLFKKLSTIPENGFTLFPVRENFYKMPSAQYFEIIQQVFNNPTPLNALSN